MHQYVRPVAITARKLFRFVTLALLTALLPFAAMPAQAVDLPPETYSQGIQPTITWEGSFVNDDGYANGLPIGFTFNYFGADYTQFSVSSNGFLSFTTLANSTFTNAAIPNTNVPNNHIAAFWDDLATSGTAGMFYQTVGAEPNRKLVFQWTNTGFFRETTPLGTVQVILYEGSNQIQVQYRYLVSLAARAHGSSATVGIENAAGTAGMQYSLNTASLSSGQAIRFTPDGSGYTMNAAAFYEGILLGAGATPAPGLPVQSCPANTGTDNTTPLFSWADAGAGVTYRLIVDNLNTFASPEINVTDLTATSYTTSTALTAGTTYYWSVVATNGVDNTWAEQWRFTASNGGTWPCAPLLIAPAQQATAVSTDPAFSWSTAPNAASYRLIVSPNANLSAPVYDQSNILGTTQSISGLSVSTVYYWQVIAINVDGSAASTVRNFTTVSPGYGSTPAPGGTIDVGSAAVSAPVTATLSISETGTGTLNVTSHSLSGANAGDFSVGPATLSILDGAGPQDLTITCTPSAAGARTATLTVHHNASGSPATYTLNCTGMLNPVTIAVAPGSVAEDDSASLVYTVSRAGSTSGALTVNFAVGGTAAFMTDYTQSGAASFANTAGTLVIPNGQASAALTITPIGDSAAEADETVVLTVIAGEGYTAGTPASASGTIAGAALATLTSTRGQPGSHFVFTAQGFLPGESVEIRVDGQLVLTLPADSNGALSFALYFGPTAPARSYAITAVAQTRRAQTSVTIDPAAEVLPPPDNTELPQSDVLFPALYIPIAIPGPDIPRF